MYEEIERRLENVRIIRSGMKEYEWQALQEFWQNVESDLRWAMAELAKFHVCDESEGCFDDRGRLHGPKGWEYAGMELVEGDVARCTVYHKGEESWGD